MINKFIGVGNLTRDIELRKTNNGDSVVTFSIAISRNYKNQDGEYDSDFINCVAWRNTAEYLNKYAHKGDKIAVAGRVQVRSYQKDGQNVYVTEIICEECNVLKGGQIQTSEQQYKQPVQKPIQNNVEFDTDDLPFM